ncbi:MAG TPA: hypothetical protein VI854_05850, partial [Acidimicrobiia bacterium]|nr:hypothetical protein [Acidimicrobiia bacterium]
MQTKSSVRSFVTDGEIATGTAGRGCRATGAATATSVGAGTGGVATVATPDEAGGTGACPGGAGGDQPPGACVEAGAG